VKTNLKAGRIRLLFVADQIPDELKRIVEFLNAQMDPAEVLALELRRFDGEGLKTIVPVVYGRTEVARRSKGSVRPARRWDRESFFAALEKRSDPQTIQVAKRLEQWMQQNGRIVFGSGADGSMTMDGGSGPSVCRIWTFGRFVFFFEYLMRTAAFKEETKRVELLARLNQIDGMKFTEDMITRRWRIMMRNFFEGTRLKALLAVLDWVVDELKRSDVAHL